LQSALKGKECSSSKLHKEFHSTPDLKGFSTVGNRKSSKCESPTPPTVDSKSKSLSQENLNKLRANPRHSWACISSTVQALFDRNYEGSWKSIEKLPDPPPEADLPAPDDERDLDGNDSDDGGSTASHSSSSGEEETPKASVNTKSHPVTPLLPNTEEEYRTLKKPLRPVQSKTLPRRASTGCTISPAEQQTIINLVPPGQVIKVDVNKSSSKEYGTVEKHGGSGTGTLRRPGDGTSPSNSGVMSSFKPTDSAKLYASPDDLKPVIGYREQRGGSGDKNSGENGTLKKSRSHSLPPAAPGSAKKDGTKVGGVGDYAEPVNKGILMHNGSVVKESTSYIPSQDDNKSNINSTNGSFSSSHSRKPSLGGGSGITGATPNINASNGNVAANNNNNNQFDPQKSLQEAKDKLRPVKPVLKSSSSLSGPSPDSGAKIRIEVKQSPRLARKAEKTVTFQSDSPPATPVNNASGNNISSSQQSMSHSMSVDEIQKVKTSLKVSKSFPNDLGQDEGGNPDSAPGQHESHPEHEGKYVTNLPVNPDSDSSEDSSDKTWILKDENGPSSASTTSDSVQTVISAAGTIQSKQSLLQQQQEEKISNLTHVEQQVKKPLSASAQLGITHNFEQQLQQQHHLQQQLYGRTAQQQTPAESNYGTVSRTSRQGSGNMGHLTKNAVSLVKLPPPMEIESESEEGRSTPVQKKTMVSSSASSTTGGATTPSSQQMYHTLQPQRSRSMLTPEQPQQLQHQYHLQQQQIAARQLQQLQGQVQGQARQAEKSIEESLKLIQMHVAALKVITILNYN